MALLAAIVFAFGASPSPQASLQVVAEESLEASPFAWQRPSNGGDGGWRVWVESLPQQPHHRRSAARFVPWRVVRGAGDGEPETVLRWTDPAWPAARVRPAHVVVDEAGTVLLCDRWGTRFCVFPAGAGPRRDHELRHEDGRQVARLEPEGVLHRAGASGRAASLHWTPLGDEGFGATIALPPLLAPSSGAAARIVRAGRELVWCSGPELVTALDVGTGELREIAFPEAAAFTLERAVGGWLFARANGRSERCFYRELRLTHVSTGETASRPAPRSFAAWGPAGIFTSHAFHDPVASRHAGLAEPVWIHGTFVWTAADRVAFRSRRGEPWRLLHLDERDSLDPAPLTEAGAVVDAALVRGTALDSTEFALQVRAAGWARSPAAIDLYARVLRSDAGTNAKTRAASLLAAGGLFRARAPLREALEVEQPGTLKIHLAGCLATFMQPADSRVIEAAIPVGSLPTGTRHGDAAVRVAEALAVLGNADSVPYLEALLARAPFERVRRALESVQNAARFRRALAEARDG